MSGFQELLLILIILLAIFFIPRMTARNADQASLSPVVRRPPKHLSARLRLAILVSVIWLLGALLYLRPWLGHWATFIAIGALPLVVAWGAYWVFAGSQPHGRQRRSVNKRR
jgi:uncharacterized membrane protein YciS (DUF1049 family)